MKTIRSFVGGAWHEATSGFAPLVDPSTENEIARISSGGVDFASVVEYGRAQGGPALRELSFAQRGDLLKKLSKILREHREELLDLSRLNNGTTAPDGSFDIDGAGGTLAYYGAVGRGLGDARILAEGEGMQLAKTEAFWGRHVLVPRLGVAVFINAFNFPAWGIAEKLACALLAGMPVIAKPASATALVAERWVEIVVSSGILPDGALQLVCGSTGDLLERLTERDVVAFTGSADTARLLRTLESVQRANPRFNVEADSLNAAVLGPDVDPAGPTFALFVREVTREMTQKAGQKCTAVRRILVPKERLSEVREALDARLARVVTGNPAEESVRMGPLATASQLEEAERGVARLLQEATMIRGSATRIDGEGSPEGRGYFFAPTLLEVEDAARAETVHHLEVFAPVATLVPYDGEPASAARIVTLGGGTLVTSAYSDDRDWVASLVAGAGSSTGRFYLGSAASAEVSPGSGVALPQTIHGGPGRAGGGEELGGLLGVKLYMQRLALQGDREQVDGLASGPHPASTAPSDR